MKPKNSLLSPFLSFAQSILLFIGIWFVIALWVQNPIVLPSPLQVFEKGIALVNQGVALESIVVSFTRFISALLAAILIGIPIGLLMGLWTPAKKSLYVIVELFRPISAIAWLPIGLALFGIGNNLAVFIIFYASVFPIIVNTTAGVYSVKKSYIDAAQVLGARKTDLLWNVIIPGSMPGMFMGIRVALGLGWMSIIAAEMIGTTSGLGYLIDSQRKMTNTDGIIFLMFAIALLGFIIDFAIKKMIKMTTPWMGKEK